jgi:CheY-like chemotaxis protein
MSDETVPRGDETVLVVEDEESVRSFVVKVLDDLGYTVMEAADGPAALRLCASYHGTIDLLLTDVVLPKMSGREVAEKLLPLRPDIVVLYTSGYTEDSIVRNGVLTEEVNFLEKPITVESLAQAVRGVLDSELM